MKPTMIPSGVVFAQGVIEDAIPLSQVLLNALRWLLSFFGMVALVALVLAGIWYMFSSGDETRSAQAKRMILFILIGLSVGLSALIIVRFLGSVIQ
jgi:cbb3-type cytochrome oxidase subunit 3